MSVAIAASTWAAPSVADVGLAWRSCAWPRWAVQAGWHGEQSPQPRRRPGPVGVVIGWLHDAVLEDLLDRAARRMSRSSTIPVDGPATMDA